MLIINGIWLETFWSWSFAVSISRARQISSYKNLGIYLRCNLCLNPKKKSKVTFYSHKETLLSCPKRIPFLLSSCHGSLFYIFSSCHRTSYYVTLAHFLTDEVEHSQKMLWKKGRLKKQNPKRWECQGQQYLGTSQKFLRSCIIKKWGTHGPSMGAGEVLTASEKKKNQTGVCWGKTVSVLAHLRKLTLKFWRGSNLHPNGSYLKTSVSNSTLLGVATF